MTRKDELLQMVTKKDSENRIKAEQLIDEIVFLEERMAELKKMPFIASDPKNPMHQKATPASKQYKEFLQQYNNSLRLLLKLSGDIGGDEDAESPLRTWAKSRKASAND